MFHTMLDEAGVLKVHLFIYLLKHDRTYNNITKTVIRAGQQGCHQQR